MKFFYITTFLCSLYYGCIIDRPRVLNYSGYFLLQDFTGLLLIFNMKNQQSRKIDSKGYFVDWSVSITRKETTE